METIEILDTSVAMRRKDGVITIFTVIEYPPCNTNSFDVLVPEMMDYITAIEIAQKLRKKGKPIGSTDIIIAAMCLNRSAELVTKDNDFKNIKEEYADFKLKITDF